MQGGGVQAVAKARGERSVIEDVAEVRVATAAGDRGAVLFVRDRPKIEALKKEFPELFKEYKRK